MWILRYLILATRQRCNALLDRRTRMNFDPLHGCPMYVCADKAEWDRRGKDQVAQLESELRQDIEAYHTGTGERRVIAGETIEVRPVVLEKEAEPVQAAEIESESEVEKTILPEAAPETEAAPAQTGDALVSSGVEAQAEAEPGADPTSLAAADLNGLPQEDTKPEPEKMDGTGGGQDSGISGLGTVPEPAAPTEAAAPKAKTKPAGKAGKK